MQQASPQFKEFTGSREDLAKSIGLNESDLHADLPILYGSTGTWTLLIPIKQLDAFKKMEPNNKQFPEILKKMPKSLFILFVLKRMILMLICTHNTSLHHNQEQLKTQ